MKKQTGIWVDGQAWRAYRDLCSREKLRSAEPIEEFVRFVLRSGSAAAVLNVMQSMEKARSEGLESYARVLLNWYANGRSWISVTDENEAPVEPMLLNALRDVGDPQLRREIEEALMTKPRKKGKREKRTEKTEDAGVENSKDVKKKTMSVDELLKGMDDLKRLVKDARTS